MPRYSVGKLDGRFVVNIYSDAGRRIHRYRLDAGNAREAQIEAPGIFSTLTRPKGTPVAELWNAYVADRADRAIAVNMPFTWMALKPRFAGMEAEEITVEDCRAHTAARRKAGIKDGTISTELGRLRMVCRWAEKRRLIKRTPMIERPAAPKRRERHLTWPQCKALVASAPMPHVRLYIVLALATGGRNAALVELTWDRCDFERGEIDLRNPEIVRPHKGRAIVPMNKTIRAALFEAQAGALSDYVIEWAGKPVTSVRRGLKSAAVAAGIKGAVSPHLLRHSAAVRMAEDGVPMAEIAQYLGHDDDRVTSRVYARFSPTHLRRAAAALEIDTGSTNRKHATFSAPEIPDYMVGATGIEPVTPTMSRKRAG